MTQISPSSLNSVVLALGNFDGVHLGHQALIKKAVHLANSLASYPKVVTFNPHPRALLTPPHTRIMSPEDQAKIFISLGCLEILCLEFNAQMRDTEAVSFLNGLMTKVGKIKAIVVGYNFRFGKDRKGDAETLRAWGLEHQVEIEIVEPVLAEGQIVSTSQIRRYLAEGQMEWVTKMLGRPLQFCGTVEPGDQRGRQLGFPTLNLEQILTQMPGAGVYIAMAWVFNQGFWGVIHIGPLPTFGVLKPRVELHLLDFDQEIYQKEVQVQVLSKIRDIQNFESKDHLIKQIQSDIITCKNWVAAQ